MDDIVLRGMARWPNVPAVYGWLALDRRANWLIKGERIGNALVTDFMNRNYAQDPQGRWYFQNGPQRVFVALDYTPLVFRLHANDGRADFTAHTGAPAGAIRGVYVDEAGCIILDTDAGVGLVDDRDVVDLPACLTDAAGEPLDDDGLIAGMEAPEAAGLRLRCGDRLVAVASVRAADVPGRFGFVDRPVPPPGVEECY